MTTLDGTEMLRLGLEVLPALEVTTTLEGGEV